GSQEGSSMAKSIYDETYARSMRDPQGFWAAAAEDIHWDRRWDRVFDDSRRPFYRWFTGGELNTCYNALDLHVDRGRGKQRALVYDSPVTGTVRTFTYRELRDAVALCAGMLRRQGVAKGDRVIVYMPMLPEAVIAMLACPSPPPIRSTSCTPRAPRAFPRASCTTTGATPSPSSGRWARCTAWARARSTGPPRISAGWSATRTSSTRRCSRAAPRSSTRA